VIRHTTAVHMRRAGDDSAAIAALLGHAHPTTTESVWTPVHLRGPGDGPPVCQPH
jgi:integrase